MNLSANILKLFGWKVRITVPDYPKSISIFADRFIQLLLF